jgi:hypothetical protein
MLSPSSAGRWIHCPPSAKLNAEAPQKDTVYTREGTLAHAVCELKARKHFISGSGLGPKKYKAAMDRFRAEELWQDEMEGYTDDYLEALKDISGQFTTPPHVALEVQVDFSGYVPGGFGTADCIMIGQDCLVEGDVLHVIDFKYGRGVEVSAKDNPQMMLYALGALESYPGIYDIFTVRMTIVQPRVKREPESWELPARDLLRWAEHTVKPAAKLAAEGEGEYAEGEWCRFCAARGNCRARAAVNLALEDFGEKLPPMLTDEEVARALTTGQRLKQWLTDLDEYALGACLDGREIPGFKAVEGRAVRTWTNQDDAFNAARAEGIPDEMLYERKPVTLTALEKLMGRKAFAEVMKPYVTIPPGKPTLVKAEDKRPAINNRTTAEDDFKEE